MVLQLPSGRETTTQPIVRQQVRDLVHAMEQWPHWEEVYLNCVKESPASYEAFAEAIRAGDTSPRAYDDMMRRSQMTRSEFEVYLPELQRFLALCSAYQPGMLSDGVDRLWHGFLLISRLYREFCQEFLGRPLDHLPCSLYPLYGVDVSTMSCINKCVPSTCKGNGGGCNPDDIAVTKESILSGTQAFVDAYRSVFESLPDVTIWNQLAGYIDLSH